MIYKFAEGFRLQGKAQDVGDHLERLEKRVGRLDSKVVLEDARNADSPIHAEFEWSDVTAAEYYRESQARYLLRSVVAVMDGQDGEEKTVRAFVNIEEGDGYVPIHRVFESAEMTEQLLGKALGELRKWQHKYSVYKELSGLCRAIDEQIQSHEQLLSPQASA